MREQSHNGALDRYYLEGKLATKRSKITRFLVPHMHTQVVRERKKKETQRKAT
jgi:hypothetical protein